MTARVTAVALVTTIALATPAVAGPSVATRLKRLEHRVSALAVLIGHERQAQHTHVVQETVTGAAMGESATDTVLCDTGDVTGGGGEFVPFNTGDRLTVSKPAVNSVGWTATGQRGTVNTQSTFVVYAVCTGP